MSIQDENGSKVATKAQPALRRSPKPVQSKGKAKSDATDSIHQLMSGLHEVGLVSMETMRTFDAGCLEPPKAFAPTKIASIRRSARMSQPVFAAYLGTTKSTVAKWESGEKKPNGPSRRLLEIVAKHGIEILA